MSNHPHLPRSIRSSRPKRIVSHGQLLCQRTSVKVGSPAWFAWLDDAALFSYFDSRSSYRISVRKEKRGHQSYWYGYLKKAPKLHKVYIGKSGSLTLERLQTICDLLVARAKAQGQQR